MAEEVGFEPTWKLLRTPFQGGTFSLSVTLPFLCGPLESVLRTHQLYAVDEYCCYVPGRCLSGRETSENLLGELSSSVSLVTCLLRVIDVEELDEADLLLLLLG